MSFPYSIRFLAETAPSHTLAGNQSGTLRESGVRPVRLIPDLPPGTVDDVNEVEAGEEA